MLRKIKIARKPDVGLLIQIGAFVGAVSIAGACGFALGTTSPATPQSCSVAFTAAERAFVSYENLATSTYLAATRGRSEFAGHEADKASARGELDDLGPVYRDEKAECLGGVR
jgi:hypothetical protein